MCPAVSAAIASSGPRGVLGEELAWKVACTCTLAPTGNVPKLQVTVPAFRTPPLSAEIKLAPFGTVARSVERRVGIEIRSGWGRLQVKESWGTTVFVFLRSCRLMEAAGCPCAARRS